MTSAIGVALLTQQASASEGDAIDVLCATADEPLTDGIFRGVLAFGDRHGEIAIIEACSDRVFGINYRDSDLLEPENAELLAFLRRQAFTDRFAAAIDIRADFEPNADAPARYPGTLRVKQVLAFHPTERRLFDFLESSQESEQAKTSALPSP